MQEYTYDSAVWSSRIEKTSVVIKIRTVVAWGEDWSGIGMGKHPGAIKMFRLDRYVGYMLFTKTDCILHLRSVNLLYTDLSFLNKGE